METHNSSWVIDLQERRMSKLERKLRIAIGGWIITFGVMLVSAWTWQAQFGKATDILRARQIVIVDERGVERIHIGSPVPDALVAGKRIKRQMPSTGIVFSNLSGDEVSGWGVFDSGNQNLCFDYKGAERLCLVQAGERGGLVVKDEKGTYLMMLGRIGFEEDAPKLFLNDFSGKTRIKLRVSEAGGAPKLEMFDEKGQQVFLAPSTKDTKRE